MFQDNVQTGLRPTVPLVQWALATPTLKLSLIEGHSIRELASCLGSHWVGYKYTVRSEVFRAVTMKSAVFWDINCQFVPHRSHITAPLQIPAG
jgi:hypothetical protein